ncbi:MAG TPA: pyrroloquinoline quinone-dependent dehydrogenase [Bryobacterales bacterium]|nr:pyrroloquinoline quinone-dependent dehydrogenase [Bryobacterales bacterium]
MSKAYWRSGGLSIRPAIILALAAVAGIAPGAGPADWPVYGRDAAGTRYSPLAQITRQNVRQLRVAWIYHTGDVLDGEKTGKPIAFEATPIEVDGTLYFPTPFDRVIALDPETGQERWKYDPKVDLTVPYGDGLVSRGVASWRDSKRGAKGPCRRRIFLATLDARLIALDAATGLPCADFGKGGQVDLSQGVGSFRPGEYHMTSAPTVAGDIVVVGSAIDDNQRMQMPSGVVRGYDARTGARRWSWDPTPKGETGAANAWSTMSADPERDLVFVPTGSASPDYYGGGRKGSDLYANSVIALRASTGKLAWAFQSVHHDLWDYDVTAQPTLITLRRGGKEIPAVIVTSKTGNVFVLDRRTGAPLFPVEERPVPQSDVPGEQTSPTQPFPSAPPPLVPQMLTAEDAWGVTPEDRARCREWIQSLRSEGIFTPPSLARNGKQGTLAFPGHLGGVTWGGVAVDPGQAVMVVNTNRLAAGVTLIPREKLRETARAKPEPEYASQTPAPYAMSRQFLFIGPNVRPCNPPPWGALTAVDLAAGKVRWEVPLGTMSASARVPEAAHEGSVNLGGPMITAGGLVFIAAARDNFLRAFDIASGEELWKAELPAGGQATPMTYQVRGGGKQYVIIAAGGHGRFRTKLGDAVVAFALP